MGKKFLAIYEMTPVKNWSVQFKKNVKFRLQKN